MADPTPIRLLPAPLATERSSAARHNSIPRSENNFLAFVVVVFVVYVTLLINHISTSATTDAEKQPRLPHPFRHLHCPVRKLGDETLPAVDGGVAV